MRTYRIRYGSREELRKMPAAISPSRRIIFAGIRSRNENTRFTSRRISEGFGSGKIERSQWLLTGTDEAA